MPQSCRQRIIETMQKWELIAPCHFGLESEVKKEIYNLGYDITDVDDGRVTFEGDAEAIVRANMSLRIAERILLKAGSFRAQTFEELFQGTKAIPWEEFLPEDAKFWVKKASSVRSKLFSPSDIQSIMKKAMVERMSQYFGITQFPETGAEYPVRVFIKKDIVTVAIDTTGESLHKRGYRKYMVTAPIAENLAAGLLSLTPWKPGRILIDPFCGSGTFLIEAAMQSAHIAPGLTRDFTSKAWTNLIPTKLWEEVREELQEEVDLSVPCDLQGYDNDRDAIYAARQNARLAGVEDLIHFQVRPVSELSHAGRFGFILTNPPYGERLSKEESEELRAVYAELGERFRSLKDWSLYVISAYPKTQEAIGMKAAKCRKIYNGMIRTYFYQFPGKKPGKEDR